MSTTIAVTIPGGFVSLPTMHVKTTKNMLAGQSPCCRQYHNYTFLEINTNSLSNIVNSDSFFHHPISASCPWTTPFKFIVIKNVLPTTLGQHNGNYLPPIFVKYVVNSDGQTLQRTGIQKKGQPSPRLSKSKNSTRWCERGGDPRSVMALP